MTTLCKYSNYCLFRSAYRHYHYLLFLLILLGLFIHSFIHSFIHTYRYTSRNCAHSCRDCNGKRSAAILKETEYLLLDDGSGCVDMHADCFERIRDGGCLQNDPYMTHDCRRSCRLCQPKTTPDARVEEAHHFSQMLLQQQGDMSASRYIESETCIDLSPSCRSLKRKNGCEKEKT